MSTDTRPTPAQQSTAAATDVAEFITDLDGGQFERLLSIALSQTAAAVVDNGKKGEVKVTFQVERIPGTLQREHYAALESERDALREELAELRKQEPVAWQCRFHISDSWAECSREHHDLVKSAQTEFQDYEARALYAAPKPGEQQ